MFEHHGYEGLSDALHERQREGDIKGMTTMPEPFLQSGTSEYKNWIPVGAIMHSTGLPMDVVDYVPCYRSSAGTGNAMGFVRWM